VALPGRDAGSGVLVAVNAALFVSMLDTTVVTVALPDLQQRSTLGVADLQWVVNGYLVVFAALTLAGGALADRFGRRRLLVAGLLVFAAGSVVTAAADPTGGWDGVRTGRVLQGLGAALSEPATLAVVRESYAGARERARALGVWAAVAALAIALGPVVGGVLVAAGGWRAVFWANVPLAAVALALVLRVVPESRDPRRRRPDVPGLVLAAVGLAALSTGLIEGQESGFATRGVVLALAVAAVAGLAFLAVEARAADPALPAELVAGRGAGPAVLATLAASFAVFAVFFFVSLDLQTVSGASPAGTASAFLPLAAVMVVTSLLAGRWAGHSGGWPPMVAGLLVAAAGLLVVDRVLTGRSLDAAPPLTGTGVGLAIVGAGLGLVLAPAATVVLAAVEPARAGVAAAVVNLSRQVGGLLAVAVLGAVAVGHLKSELADTLARQGYSPSFTETAVGVVTHPGTGGGLTRPVPGHPGPFDALIRAGQEAFVSGLHRAVLVAVGVLVAAVLVCCLARLAGCGSGFSGRRVSPGG